MKSPHSSVVQNQVAKCVNLIELNSVEDWKHIHDSSTFWLYKHKNACWIE